MILSRREFAKLSLATPGVVLLASSLPEYKDVVLGVTTYSYRDLDLDTTLRAMTAAGVRICEFFERHAFPAKPASESWNDYNNRMRAWVLEQPIEHFRSIGNRFKDAGITIHSLTHPFRVDDSDADIRRAYDMARALGAAYIFSSTQASLARKLSAYSEQYGIGIAMHNHSKAPELCRPEEFEQAIAVSPSIGINLDIGHFVAAGYDPLPFIEKYHARIRGMHIKDRKRNQGVNTPFGEADTPIREVLQLCQRRKYAIPALVEYEYKGADPIVEVQKCLDYMKAAVS